MCKCRAFDSPLLRAKIASLSPTSKNRSLGTPNRRGPRVFGDSGKSKDGEHRLLWFVQEWRTLQSWEIAELGVHENKNPQVQVHRLPLLKSRDAGHRRLPHLKIKASPTSQNQDVGDAPSIEMTTSVSTQLEVQQTKQSTKRDANSYFTKALKHRGCEAITRKGASKFPSGAAHN